MTKSRTALMSLVPLLAAWPGAAAAQAVTAVTAEEAIARQQAMVRDVVERRCAAGAESGDIVVCGRREPIQRYRVPLPVQPAPGVHGRAGGEQLAAMDAGNGRCSTVGRDQQCGGGLDVIGIGFTIARAVVKALANRD